MKWPMEDPHFRNRFVIGCLSAYNLARFDGLGIHVSGVVNDFRLEPINRPTGREKNGALK